MAENTTRVAVDIGGTFTDLVAVEDGALTLEKASTTPANFADGVVDSLAKSDLDPGALDQFVHGTTVVINAITERDGEDTALLTTEGFRDVLDITRANRPDMFNYQYQKPEPFVPVATVGRYPSGSTRPATSSPRSTRTRSARPPAACARRASTPSR